jgi:hypothetical protein
MIGIGHTIFKRGVLRHLNEKHLNQFINCIYFLTLCGIIMLICGNSSKCLPLIFIGTMVFMLGAYIGHLSCSNTILMLMGSESQRKEYKFKGYILAENA